MQSLLPSRRGAVWWWIERMSIAAINEQLLRAIGVGVALLELESLSLRFGNDTFREWFGEIEPGQHLGDLFAGLDIAAIVAGLASEGRKPGA